MANNYSLEPKRHRLPKQQKGPQNPKNTIWDCQEIENNV
jgi:hypothetical protein